MTHSRGETRGPAEAADYRRATENALAEFAADHGPDLEAGNLSNLFNGGVVPPARRATS